ncbi:MAG TPA: hypothetical protein VHY84_22675 [Bryobacteraceae bacterium]|jgi:uncharacterized protein YndB with AHSA1/START domain|nr:hypothetical protein [Bryobacteraceae bacterium]
MRLQLILAAAAMLTAANQGAADVADSSANGFTVRFTLNVQASPEDVYRKLIRNTGDWWSPDHTFSGNSHNLSIEEKPGGCFCEKLPNNGGVRHMEVVYLAPGRTLVLSGALGPLQSLGATGSMTIAFSPLNGGTKLDVAYSVVGYSPAGMNTWAAPVDEVLKLQFARLKNYAEHGDPAAVQTAKESK